MNTTEDSRNSRVWGRRIALLAGVLAFVSCTAFVSWSLTCPCEMSPGGYLFGAGPDGPVTDWSFANDVPLCQIQVSIGVLPYSINLNCMSTPEGGLYLSCGFCDNKRWSGLVVDEGDIRIRLDEVVYPVTATRVMDPAELDRAWDTRVMKLQVHSSDVNPAVSVGTARPDRWWSFRLESR
jgi:hypothetical protein